MSESNPATDSAITQARSQLDRVYAQIGRVLIGQQKLVDRLLLGLLTGGHVLLEGVPGLAKTLTVRTLAQSLRLSFQRIQFTPDLLPADVIGTQIYNPRSGEFSIRKGPIFAHIVLADEINRAPAKVQSALLEAMQEKQVTIGDTSFTLEEPFLVLATQNPIEQEGTYPLPEAQIDRFMFKLLLDYPSKDEELAILERMGSIDPSVSVDAVLAPEDLFRLRKVIDGIFLDDRLKSYLVDLVRATRHPGEYGLDLGPFIQLGASPRATIYLGRGARAQAFLSGRSFVLPQDIKDIAPDVLRHRISVTYEAEAEEITSDHLLGKILAHLPIP